MYSFDERVFCHVVNCVLFLCLFLFSKRKRGIKRFDQSDYVYLIWTISSVFSLLYVFSPDTYEGQGDTLLSNVFLVFGLFVLFSWPIYFCRDLDANDISDCNNPLLEAMCYFVALISILPFIEHTFHLFSSDTLKEMGSYHDEKINLNSASHLSYVSGKLMIIILYFKYVTPVLFLYYVNKNHNSRNRMITIGLFMSLLIDVIRNFSIGARFYAIQDFSLYIFLYLYFRNTFSSQTKKKLVKISSIISILVGMGILSITIYRFATTSDEGILVSLYRYAGEGFGNLYSDMMYITQHTYGAHIFRQLFDIPSETLSFITGIRMFVYYTFIGDFYADFGLLTTVIFFVIISSVVYYTLIRKRRKSWGSICLFILYVSILTSGFMYTPFMNTFNGLIGAIIFIILYNLYNILKRN